MEADGLFVHGPLREGGSQHPWLLRTHPEGLSRAWVAGRLFRLPDGSPALVRGGAAASPAPGAGWVTGDFVGYEDAKDLDQALADLDALEGVEEGRCHREVCPVHLEGGAQYQAWVYLFHVERLPRLEREAVELLDGDWSPYL